jgi:hypothetical protein
MEEYEDTQLEYARYTYGYDFGEELTVQWSTNESSWNTVGDLRRWLGFQPGVAGRWRGRVADRSASL